VRITSEISILLKINRVILAAPQLFYRSLLVSLIVSCSQLMGVGFASADELIQSQINSVDRNAEKKYQAHEEDSFTGRLEESLSLHFRNEVHCLALNIYFEARSEPESGQRAVGHVVMNRVAHRGYPNSVCQVVQQGGEKRLHRCQFSWWCDGQSDKPVNQKAWGRSLRLARKIYLGTFEDTTDGALWYHANYVKPYWSDVLLQGDKIGQHIFYLENRQSR